MWIVVALVAMQTVASLAFARQGLEWVRTGIVSVLHAGLFFWSAVLLVVGAAMLLRRVRAVTYVFGGSAILGAVILSQWQPLLVTTGVIVAAIGCVVGLKQVAGAGGTS